MDRGLPRPSERVGHATTRSEEHTSELQSRPHLVCRLLLEKKNLAAVRGAWGPAGGPGRQGVRQRLVAGLGGEGTCASFFFSDTATTEIYTLSLHDALPISSGTPR